MKMEYQHGGDIYSHRVDMDYSANINPLGLPKGVRAALTEAIETCSHYPDSRCGRLRKALAEFHHVPENAVICGNGAADLIFQITAAVKPKRAMLLAPSFLEYEQALRQTGCRITYFDLKQSQGFALSIGEICEKLKRLESEAGRGPDLLFLCNPNNPTGLAVEKAEMRRLLDFCRNRRIFCVIDECFNEFLDEPDRYSVLECMRQEQYENVFLLKAFTKIYAMAGVRLGYGICWNQEILRRMEAARQPWSVSCLAQAAGEAALKETDYVEKTRQLISRERTFMRKRLEDLGFFVYPSMANYLFFTAPKRMKADNGSLGKCTGKGWLYDACLDRGVLIRSCFNYRGLSDSFYRVCIKTSKENQRFLWILQSIIEERKLPEEEK